MNFKMLTMGAMALAMMTGSALAAGSSTAGSTTSALDDQTKMAPFYTDSGMKTMRSEKEFKAAWMAMNDEDRASMIKECSDKVVGNHEMFCKSVKQYAN